MDIPSDLRDKHDSEIEEEIVDEPEVPQDTRETDCTENVRRCVDENTIEICLDSLLMTEHCAPNTVCAENTCLPVICEPNQGISCETDIQRKFCNTTGTGYLFETCEGELGNRCDHGICTNQICIPENMYCYSSEIVERCSPNGEQLVFDHECYSGTTCIEGECKELCSINSKAATYIGCEYMAADLDNESGHHVDQQYAVVLSNPHPRLAAQIQIYKFNNNGEESELTLETSEIPGLSLQVFNLPRQDLDTTEVSFKAFHIKSNIPITAHQFNPLNNTGVYSNDASLLLPHNALGMEYFIINWPNRDWGDVLNGFATIIATEEGQTRVTITSPAETYPGFRIPTMVPGEPREFILEQYQVLNLQSANTDLVDITGMHIRANAKIAVFSGHECAYVPTDVSFCDHLEQQMYPVNTWGNSHIATKTFPRGTEPDFWRILAAQDDTIIETNPPQTGNEAITLNRGEFTEFSSTEHFEITANNPILVGQFIVGSRHPDLEPACLENAGLGDPTFLLNVPSEQFRDDYLVMVPENYQSNYFNVVSRSNTTILMDDVPLDIESPPIGSGAFRVSQVPVTAGAHRLHSEEPFGLVVYGYDCDVSYGYPGGLNLEDLIE